MTQAWRQDWQTAERVAMAGDASARRYTRLKRAGGTTAILMEDPDPANRARFWQVAAHLRDIGLSVPQALAPNVTDEADVIEDFGATSLAALLKTDPDLAEKAYTKAVEVLTHLSAAPLPIWAETPDRTALTDMIRLTFTRAGCDAAPVCNALEALLTAHCAGPATLSLRDYHADNLMWLPARRGFAQVGLLDFQDAVALPAGYDLASLFDDPRRDVPVQWRTAHIAGFAERRAEPTEAALARVGTLSLLRNLRILGIFNRLATEAGRPSYQAFLPRTWALIDRVCDQLGFGSMQSALAPLRAATAAWMP